MGFVDYDIPHVQRTRPAKTISHMQDVTIENVAADEKDEAYPIFLRHAKVRRDPAPYIRNVSQITTLTTIKEIHWWNTPKLEVLYPSLEV